VRAVYDTIVMRAGVRSRRQPEYRCLQMIGLGRVVLLGTAGLFLEYEEVLTRPETLAATGLSREDVARFLTGLAAVIEPVRIDFDWRPMLRDPDDDMLANCAANGAADCVVTNNLRHVGLIEQLLGVPVLRPAEFLAAVETVLEEQPEDEED
jgi:predicted nucleic acid-binding protein